MTLPVVLRAEAEAEYEAAFDFYEALQPGLGPAFAARVRECLSRIAANPKLYAVVLDDIRQSLVRKFPYFVCFRERPADVEVIAVMHTSRDPGAWQSRLATRN